MNEKPKVDPFLAAGPPPGTRLRPEEAPKPRPKAKKRSANAVATPSAASTTPPIGSPSSAPVTAELLESGALVPAAPQLPAPLGARPKSRKEREMERMERVDASIRQQASRILLHAFAGSELPDDGSRPEGWSDRKFRTARDARLSHKEAPTYIQHAARTVESYRRSEALEKKEGRPTASLNANISFYVRNDIQQIYNYEVIEQKDE